MSERHDPADKVIANTGGGRGIGQATAVALLRRGATVAIGDIDVETARATADALGARCAAFRVDVTERASVDAFVDAVEAALGPIDVFINNAGIMPTVRFLEGERREHRAAVRDQHVRCDARHAGRYPADAHPPWRPCRERRSAGKFGVPGVSTYCATKHAVVGLSNSMRAELRDTTVDLSVVMPVIVRTALTDGVADTRDVKTLQPEEVAASIVEAIETRPYEVCAHGRSTRCTARRRCCHFRRTTSSPASRRPSARCSTRSTTPIARHTWTASPRRPR